MAGRIGSALVGVPAYRVRDRGGEEKSNGEREYPPPVHAVVREFEDEGDGGDDTCNDSPVVSDDEVIPELPELHEPLHELDPSWTADARCPSATSPNAT